jgi:beta-N-acetylhexosaminidase
MKRDSKPSIGQLLILGFDGTEMKPRLASLLRRVQPAGVILFTRNIRNPEQTWQLLKECQKCVATPLFTCIDLEGGTVDRLRDALEPTPSAADVFATGDRRLFRKHGQIIGESCRAFGFNVNFAPVFDLALEPSRSVMGSRTVSASPRETIRYAREFLAGLRWAKILGCGKHFPGLGEGRLDSHHEMPVIEKPLKRLWAEDLLPYRVLRAQLPFVMISHAAYPQVTKDRTPASLSKVWISDILRKRIGYRGLIASDDLEMAGVRSVAPVGQAAVEFIRAGGDLCLVCHREEFVLQAYEELVKAAERDQQFARRVRVAAGRVLAFKKKRISMLRAEGFACSTGPADIPHVSQKQRDVGHPQLSSLQVPSEETVARLTRRLWEFAEQVRLERLS